MLGAGPSYPTIVCLDSWTAYCHWGGSYDGNASRVFPFYARWLETGNPADIQWIEDQGKSKFIFLLHGSDGRVYVYDTAVLNFWVVVYQNNTRNLI